MYDKINRYSSAVANNQPSLQRKLLLMKMENILTCLAVPFNPPTYTGERSENINNSNSILAIGDLIAEELQDSESEASKFIKCLRSTSTNQHSNCPFTCLVRWKPEKINEIKLESKKNK